LLLQLRNLLLPFHRPEFWREMHGISRLTVAAAAGAAGAAAGAAGRGRTVGPLKLREALAKADGSEYLRRYSLQKSATVGQFAGTSARRMSAMADCLEVGG